VLKQFFYENQFMGSTELPASRDWEQHAVWFCTRCGRPYAREAIAGSERLPVLWTTMQGCCSKCLPAPWHWNQVPGSVWRNNDVESNKFLPEAMLRQELLLTIAAKEHDLL